MGFIEKHIIFNGSRSLIFGEGSPFPDAEEMVQVKKKKEMSGVVERFLDPGNNTDLVITGLLPKKLFRLFKKHFKYIKAAGGLVQNPAGEFLFIKRFDIWDLPKGKLKKGEAPGKGAMREVMEDKGVNKLTVEKRMANRCHIYIRDDNK